MAYKAKTAIANALPGDILTAESLKQFTAERLKELVDRGDLEIVPDKAPADADDDPTSRSPENTMGRQKPKPH